MKFHVYCLQFEGDSMFKEYFLIYLLAHMLGDYYFQSEQMAEQKNIKLAKLMQHSVIYLILCVIVTIPIFSVKLLEWAVVVATIHAVIDFGKYLYIKYCTKESNTAGIYIIDQAVHITGLAIVAYFMTINRVPIKLIAAFDDFLNVLNIGKIDLLSIMSVIIFLFKPANITIKQLLSKYKPDESMKFTKKDDKNAGEFIGILERLIIYILLLMNQYSAIGLVLTAKSVARYNKIAEDKVFAEYYLLGTLLSTILIILIFKIVYYAI